MTENSLGDRGRLFSAGVLALVFGLASLALARAATADIPGSRDHPLVSRYAGSVIIDYDVRDFDGYAIMTGPASTRGGKSENASSTLALEGRVTKITYEAPRDRSTLEVFRSYETALRNAGFDLLFLCQNEQCGGRNFNHAVVAYNAEFGDNYADQRYLAGKLQSPQGDIYVSLYTARNTTAGGAMRNRVYTQLDIVKSRPMQQGMVTVDAGQMSREIANNGRVALYGIHFESGQARIRQESGPMLREIGRLLQGQPNLRLIIVGHTDNVGALDYNMDLSRKRAKEVQKALEKAFGIHKDRLDAAGVGFLAPVASNRTEEGRAANRRVELIPQ
jgi:outer membrane protein OmpA-like peptidoglycan-associated protein